MVSEGNESPLSADDIRRIDKALKEVALTPKTFVVYDQNLYLDKEERSI